MLRARRDALPEGSEQWNRYNNDGRSLTYGITELHLRFLATKWPWWVDAVPLGSAAIGLLYAHPRWIVYRHHNRRPLTPVEQSRYVGMYQEPMRKFLATRPAGFLALLAPHQFPKDYYLLAPVVLGLVWGTCPLTCWTVVDLPAAVA